MGAATAAEKVLEPDFGRTGGPAEPSKPDPGTILNSHGDELPPVKRGFIVTIDKKAGETIELRKGTLWAIGIVPVFLMVMFSYGSSALGWARDDQSQKERMSVLEMKVDSLTKAIDTMVEKQNAQAIKDAEVRGYNLKAAEGPEHGAKK